MNVSRNDDGSTNGRQSVIDELRDESRLRLAAAQRMRSADFQQELEKFDLLQQVQFLEAAAMFLEGNPRWSVLVEELSK